MSYNESLCRNSNYPRMSQSEWDDAPWNQCEPQEKDFEVEVTYTLSKVVYVATSDYIPSCPNKDEGFVEPEDTSCTDWEKAYGDDHYTIQELLGKLKDFATAELQNVVGTTGRRSELERIIRDCQGWELQDKSFDMQ